MDRGAFSDRSILVRLPDNASEGLTVAEYLAARRYYRLAREPVAAVLTGRAGQGRRSVLVVLCGILALRRVLYSSDRSPFPNRQLRTTLAVRLDQICQLPSIPNLHLVAAPQFMCLSSRALHRSFPILDLGREDSTEHDLQPSKLSLSPAAKFPSQLRHLRVHNVLYHSSPASP